MSDRLAHLCEYPITLGVIVLCLIAIVALLHRPKPAPKVDRFDIALKSLQEQNPRHRQEIEARARQADERFAAQTRQRQHVK